MLAPEEFFVQVPPWLSARMLIVSVSGVIELALGAGRRVLRRQRVLVGSTVAAFLVVILPVDLSQAMTGTPAFGLETDAARWAPPAFQPVLIAWALWSTDAWRAWRCGRSPLVWQLHGDDAEGGATSD